MESMRSLLSSSLPPLHPPRNHPRTSLSSSVPVIHEQAAPVVMPMQTTSITRHFPALALCQEQCDDFRPPLHITEVKETLDWRRMNNAVSVCKEKKSYQYHQYLKKFERQFLYWPGLWYLSSASSTEVKQILPSSTESLATEKAKTVGIKPIKQNSSNSMRPSDVLDLAKKAAVASKAAASLSESSFTFTAADLDGSLSHGSGLDGLDVMVPIEEEATVRSRRLLERRSKKRRAPKTPKADLHGDPSLRMTDRDGKISSKNFDPSDPLRLFLWGPETKQLLTAKEEFDLSVKIQELMKLEEVKQKLQLQFGHEPTLVEWAEAVGMNCRDLQSCLHSGNRSREKMIYANSRLVVHVAKQFQNRGLSLQDLLQEGSMGLMKSLEKFKPEVGCRFSTYAYWWIRQTIRRAIVQNSRIIRLPENVYALLTQIRNMRRLFIQEGHQPTNEELARRVGIRVEKLEMVLASARSPVSMQQSVWQDEGVTFQEITADPEAEIPEISATKQLMRRHVRNLLCVLSPRERQIIRLRFGIQDGGQGKTLSAIGDMFGLSKERVRQLESRALDKLKNHLSSEGLEAYVNFLI
ncbi:hypothetical protein AAC387_Pa01g1265 [Persea americana]